MEVYRRVPAHSPPASAGRFLFRHSADMTLRATLAIGGARGRTTAVGDALAPDTLFALGSPNGQR